MRTKAEIRKNLADAESRVATLQQQLLDYGKGDIAIKEHAVWRYVPQHLRYELIMVAPDGEERIVQTI